MHAKTGKYGQIRGQILPCNVTLVKLHYEKLVIYQIFKTVFDHISKHREGSWKNHTWTNFEVFGNVVKYTLEFFKYSQS